MSKETETIDEWQALKKKQDKRRHKMATKAKSMHYALVKNGKKARRFHPTQAAVVTEAYERGAIGYKNRNVALHPEYEIVEKRMTNYE